jgi:hypothetical protein
MKRSADQAAWLQRLRLAATSSRASVPAGGWQSRIHHILRKAAALLRVGKIKSAT